MNKEESERVVEKYDKMDDAKFERLISVLQKNAEYGKERMMAANKRKENFINWVVKNG